MDVGGLRGRGRPTHVRTNRHTRAAPSQSASPVCTARAGWGRRGRGRSNSRNPGEDEPPQRRSSVSVVVRIGWLVIWACRDLWPRRRPTRAATSGGSGLRKKSASGMACSSRNRLEAPADRPGIGARPFAERFVDIGLPTWAESAIRTSPGDGDRCGGCTKKSPRSAEGSGWERGLSSRE